MSYFHLFLHLSSHSIPTYLLFWSLSKASVLYLNGARAPCHGSFLMMARPLLDIKPKVTVKKRNVAAVFIIMALKELVRI